MRRLFPMWIVDPGAFGLLVMRVVAGIALMLHGYPKLVVATSWMGPATHLPGWLQALSALAEFGGGFCLLIGFMTPLACLALIGNFVAALVMVHIAHHDPLVLTYGEQGSSYELALIYLASMIMFLFAGPGSHSVDAALFNRPARKTRGEPKIPVWH